MAKPRYTFRLIGDGYAIYRQKKRVPPSEVVRLLNTRLSHIIKHMKIGKNSILGIRKPKDQSEKDFSRSVEILAEEAASVIGFPVLLIGVKSFNDISLLEAEEMEGYGWLRKEHIAQMLDDLVEHINEQTDAEIVYNPDATSEEEE